MSRIVFAHVPPLEPHEQAAVDKLKAALTASVDAARRREYQQREALIQLLLWPVPTARC